MVSALIICFAEPTIQRSTDDTDKGMLQNDWQHALLYFHPVGRAALPTPTRLDKCPVYTEGPAKSFHVIASPTGRGNLLVQPPNSDNLPGDSHVASPLGMTAVTLSWCFYWSWQLSKLVGGGGAVRPTIEKEVAFSCSTAGADRQFCYVSPGNRGLSQFFFHHFFSYLTK